MIRKIQFLFLSCLFLFNFCNAQDLHFSQFHNSPVLTNPAHTGVFMGDVRFASNYRKQWSTISGFSTDYTTMAASLDGSFFKRKSKKGSFAGFGGYFLKDQAGDSKFGTNSFNGTASLIKSLSPDQDQFLSLAFAGGFNQRSVSTGGLTWDNQWSGDHLDTSIPGEDVSKPNFSFLDFSVGAMYFYTGDPFRKYHFGMGIFHLNKPNIGFDGRDGLKRKIMFHGGGTFANSRDNKVLQPSFIVSKQGRHLDITGGTYFRYVMHEGSVRTGYANEMAVSFGVWYRVADAVIAAIKYEYQNFNIGISYDITLSGLSPVNSLLGGPEITLIYSSKPVKVRKAGHYKNVRYL